MTLLVRRGRRCIQAMPKRYFRSASLVSLLQEYFNLRVCLTWTAVCGTVRTVVWEAMVVTSSPTRF